MVLNIAHFVVLNIAHYRKQIKNNWRALNCGGGGVERG